ncbi:MAG TPA: hypothetical protein VJU86_16465 [Pyrinomonadaceae bacterium]|nr:hypothetical protein [Pyrinomonadaceae bacterium]
MFCTECGGSLNPAGLCPTCTAPAVMAQTPEGMIFGASAAPPRVTPQVTAKVKEASRDATLAFKTFATNPVGGLPLAFNSLGPHRAMGVGIVFAIFSILCVFVGVYIVLPSFAKPDFADSLKIILFGAVPFVSLLAASGATRKVFAGEGSLQGDCFIAGASLLPIGFLVFVSSVLGIANLEIAALLVVFALCYGILMLYTGVTRISLVSESRAAFAVPVMMIVCFWLTKIIFGAMLPTLLPSPGRLFPF